MKIKRGFSLTELLVSIAIIMILSSMITLNINSHKQTAKKEAEKLEAFIHDLMRKADRMHKGFSLVFNANGIKSYWEDEAQNDEKKGTKIYWTGTLNADEKQPIISKGFKVTWIEKSDYIYNLKNNAFDPPDRTLTIQRDSDKTKYNVVFAGGRIRLENPNP